ncbi:MAG TPA: hypothetical protein VFV52_03895 [Bacilli bacterium]|nr:hypothetical protein [Bacilli bacterium]
MFDPTIFDNLKVVLEGALYELDADKRALVIGREDLVDLAGMSRAFRMRLRLPEGACVAEVELTSGLLDFAAELQRLRLAEEAPGSRLQVSFRMPPDRVQALPAIAAHMTEVWGEVAEVRHERVSVLPVEAEQEDVSVRAGSEANAEEELATNPFATGEYRVTLAFRGKIDEDNIHDIELLLDHVVSTLDTMEEVEGSR